jgi:hypothetical protein
VNAIVIVQVADGSWHIEWRGKDSEILSLWVAARALIKEKLFDKFIMEA